MDDFSGQNLKRIKDIVWHILEREPATRNSDKLLAIRVRKVISGGKDTIELQEILALPSYETIRRTRQKYQEQWLYPPTSEEVQKRRRRNTKSLLEYLYTTKVDNAEAIA